MSKVAADIASGVWEYLKKEKKTSLLPEIINELKNKSAVKSNGVIVETAKTIDSKEKKEITKLIFEKWQEKKIEFKVNESLLGGMKITQGDRVLDLSVRAKLENIYEQI